MCFSFVQDQHWRGRGHCVELGLSKWRCFSGRTTAEAALQRALRWPETVSGTILCMRLSSAGLLQLLLERSFEFIHDPWDPDHQAIHFPSPLMKISPHYVLRQFSPAVTLDLPGVTPL